VGEETMACPHCEAASVMFQFGSCTLSYCTGFRRKVYMETSKIITLCYLCSQGIELLCRRW